MTVFINNLLIYLKNAVKYKLYIKEMLKQLYAVGLQASIKKYKFCHLNKVSWIILRTDNIKIYSKTIIIYNG